ncbi:hypothetical protein [Paenibacillus sp. FSL E2-0178]|jgi:type IV secretory pathway VirB2 component (pilin)|uniref:hypothetical protein n=1 Tax=Paenibacillus sp. FSL E2-0178 TaxID=2921361 RepID=UPI00315958CD
MKRKIIKLLAFCSLAVAIIIPVATPEPVENGTNGTTQALIQLMGHGVGRD